MTTTSQTIYYTLTDEAPSLATYSFLPIVRTFTHAAGITVELSDISLASRVLSTFPDKLTADQQVEDGLAFLGELTQDSNANIIKLPNISASIPQLKACITELQQQGYDIPDFPDSPANAEEQETRDRYGKVLGSAVNPVLREGNSDRRAPGAVKAFARKFPHSMGEWSKASSSHVDCMRDGDFFSHEQSITVDTETNVTIEFVPATGGTAVEKKRLSLLAGEIIDSVFMSADSLRAFLAASMDDARENDLLWSIHLKATMMKITDPIIFGHAVMVYFNEVFEKHAALFTQIGVNPNNGLGSLFEKLGTLPDAQRAEVEQDIEACFAKRPKIAMVNSDRGITNLHVPSDVIVDASMPAMIRNSGCMWGPDGRAIDTKAVIPDRTYARIYQEAINFCKINGAFDPTTMGTVPNVGLMAKKAEEYGSHDKTYEIEEAGVMRVVDAAGKVLMQHEVQPGDIWRACQTKDISVRDWVKLGVTRSRLSKTPAVFWLDSERAHDRELIRKVETYLQDHDTQDLDIHIMSYTDAIRFTMERAVRGLDTISVTGNVLRDYLTDLFPIIELGTSAKMLSIVPMLNGGGMYETGAGGSAPKHVQQLQEENHLRWDSLGEFLALAVSLEELGLKQGNAKAKIMAKALDEATGELLQTGKSPSRKVGELDTRGSHFYVALYWAQKLAAQTEDAALAAAFTDIANALTDNESTIVSELNGIQGGAAELGGYYHPDAALAESVMCPSKTLNAILAAITV